MSSQNIIKQFGFLTTNDSWLRRYTEITNLTNAIDMVNIILYTYPYDPPAS